MGDIQLEGDDIGNGINGHVQGGEYQIKLKRQASKLQKAEATTKDTKTKSNLRDQWCINGMERRQCWPNLL